MSLDVYLVAKEQLPRPARIFIREDGRMKELTRAEWDQRFPEKDPVVVKESSSHEIYWRNITHNLNKMARAAGIYEHLWRPDESGITKAHQLIEPLRSGVARLRADPEKFKTLNPSNGWGSYDGLIEFVDDYLSACIANPDCDIKVSR